MQKLKSKVRIKKHLLYCFFVILSFSLIVGLRGNTRDTQAYYDVFKDIETLELLNPALFYLQTGMEIGFGWYSYFISLFSNSSIVLFSVYSLITFYVIYKICQLLEISFGWSLLFYLSSAYFVIQQFMQIRQGLATPIALLALVLLFKENKFSLKFLILSLSAISIHQISSMLLLTGSLLFLFRNKVEHMSLLKFKVYSLILLITVILFSKFVLTGLLVEYSSRVAVYSESAEYAQELGLFRLPNIKAFFTFLLLLVLMNEKFYQNKVFTLFYLLFTMSLAFRIGFIDFSILSGRFSTAFAYSEIFILPLVFFRFKNPFGIIFILFFTIIQAIATYGFQVPDDLYTSYFEPLK